MFRAIIILLTAFCLMTSVIGSYGSTKSAVALVENSASTSPPEEHQETSPETSGSGKGAGKGFGGGKFDILAHGLSLAVLPSNTLKNLPIFKLGQMPEDVFIHSIPKPPDA